MKRRIAQKLKTLPHAPGVYLMKNRTGKIIYVGKAKDLYQRVRQYFTGKDPRPFVRWLDDILYDLAVIITHNEKEALILENDLIKRHRPRYNVHLLDDKHFLSLRIDRKQRYPKLEVVRKRQADHALYFGPYSNARDIRYTLKLVNRHFQLRTCSDNTMRQRNRPCLQFQIKRCLGPCVLDISTELYHQKIEHVIAFLEGNKHELINLLTKQMNDLSKSFAFEKAAHIRDQIYAIQNSLEKQRVVTNDFGNRDIIGFYREGEHIEITVLAMRQGRLHDAQHFSWCLPGLSVSDILSNFANCYYQRQSALPKEILFPRSFIWEKALQDYMREFHRQAVRIIIPRRGPKKNLVDLAQRNARQAFIDKQRSKIANQNAIERLQLSLHLPIPPRRIECFDISHLFGSHIVAAMVHFADGLPVKNNYRRYKIRTVKQSDDYRSMYEVILRRFRTSGNATPPPELIVVDGGKGQLNAAIAALNEIDVQPVALIAIAKYQSNASSSPTSSNSKSDTRCPPTGDKIFVWKQKQAIFLQPDSPELFLLSRIRDEAHRFAINYHRHLRTKQQRQSELDSITGIGPKRKKKLIRQFGSIHRIRCASQEELAQIVGSVLAQRILQALLGTLKKGTAHEC